VGPWETQAGLLGPDTQLFHSWWLLMFWQRDIGSPGKAGTDLGLRVRTWVEFESYNCPVCAVGWMLGPSTPLP
jgi:hypothetical protein